MFDGYTYGIHICDQTGLHNTSGVCCKRRPGDNTDEDCRDTGYMAITVIAPMRWVMMHMHHQMHCRLLEVPTRQAKTDWGYTSSANIQVPPALNGKATAS